MCFFFNPIDHQLNTQKLATKVDSFGCNDWVMQEIYTIPWAYGTGYGTVPSLKLAVAPENPWLQDEFPFWNDIFSGADKICQFQE